MSCSRNSLSVVGTIDRNRIDASTTVDVSCQGFGVVQTVTGGGTAVFIRPGFSILGEVRQKSTDGIPLENVVVDLSGQENQTTLTDASGRFFFSDLTKGTYTVEPTKSGFLVTPRSRVVGLQQDTIVPNFIANKVGSAPGEISPLIPPAVIEITVIGAQLNSPTGESLVVPANATAVALNVTAVDPTHAGFITVWPCGVVRPLASNVNYVAGDIVPNGVIATIGNEGSVCFFSQQETDLVVDVAGWFEGTAYTGATPTRLNDTRDGTGGVLGPIDSSGVMTIQVAGLQVDNANGAPTSIPTTIGAVALNVTVVQPSRAGFVTVWPCDVARPLSSNVNYAKDQIVANGVIAPVSAAGTVCLYSLSPTHIVVDLAGWFPEQSFTGATPTRLVDTRDGTGGQTGRITPADELSIPIHGITLEVDEQLQAVPVTATAVALNVTIVNSLSSGFATVWPCGVTRPVTSNMNFVTGRVVANNVVAPIGNDGNVCLYSSGATDVVVDIAGWFSSSESGSFVGTTPKRLIDTREPRPLGPIIVPPDPPDTVIIGQPDGLSNSTSATFVFTSETGTTFQCSLDLNPTTSCTSPQVYHDLSEGNHSFEVTAQDDGVADPTPATYNWTIDVTPPVISYSGVPASPTMATSASIVFTSEAGAALRCLLDGVEVASCTSPEGFTGLSEGDHTFSVEATDAAGNSTTLTSDWTIDVTPPAVNLTGVPATPTMVTDASFVFTTEAGATLRCFLDGSEIANCISPKDYVGLAEGDHTFSVEAVDAAGNTTLITSDWTIDLTPPVVTCVGIKTVATEANGVPISNPSIQLFLNGALATDDIDGDVTDSIMFNTEPFFPMGITTVTFTTTDAAGNIGSESCTVEVLADDTVAPNNTSIIVNSQAQYAVFVTELVVSLAATDNVSITEYLITEHNATDPLNRVPPHLEPLPGDIRWVTVQETADFDKTIQYPLTQLYSLGDTVELCIWYMDSQANISERLCDSITYGNDWEGGFGQWGTDNGVWQVGTPEAGPSACNTGTRCVGTNLDGNYGQHSDSTLKSATVKLPSVTGFQQIHLRFQNWHSYLGGDSGQVRVQVWNPDTSIWGAWEDAGSAVVNVSGWSLKVVDLTAYAGETVHIAFFHQASRNCCTSSTFESTGWYIDEVSISVF